MWKWSRGDTMLPVTLFTDTTVNSCLETWGQCGKCYKILYGADTYIYITISMWTPDPHTYMCLLYIAFQSNFLFAVKMSVSNLWRLSSRCWSKAVGICDHSAARALVRSGPDVRWGDFSSSQRCLVGLRSVCRTLLTRFPKTNRLKSNIGGKNKLTNLTK